MYEDRTDRRTGRAGGQDRQEGRTGRRAGQAGGQDKQEGRTGRRAGQAGGEDRKEGRIGRGSKDTERKARWTKERTEEKAITEARCTATKVIREAETRRK